MVEYILSAINTCNNGDLIFNHGTFRAFLYKKKWYPLRAIFAYAYQLANKESPTTNEALRELAYSIPYIRIADIEFKSNFPIEINQQKIIEEIRLLRNVLNELLQ